MNNGELELWRKSVTEHIQVLDTLADDRISIKNIMSNHLRQYFDFDKIEFADTFSTILLKWSYEHNPVIRLDDLDGLGMDFIITHDYSDDLGHGVVVELYPFGVPVDGKVRE